ncbi:MAG TPA: 6-pyruvoyl-tetrahydropterin synthase-related protein, partial [Pyrinomonadaceae bacterium]|nr:6-pyruvoyl-tetrahydropterin synthase-related protein [Pyrinomonadaceae bacterium]
MTSPAAAVIPSRVVSTNQPAGPAETPQSPEQLKRTNPVQHDLRPVLVVSLVAVVALLPVIIFGIPNGADLFNHFRFALPFYDSIRSGVFYPGWLAESNNGLGDPRFRFYPPGLYYFLAATRILFADWYVGSVACLVLLSVLAGLGIYFWARMFLEPKLAMWAGVFFTIAPYHLNQIYQASLLSEYAACSVLPFAFAFVERICRRKKAYDIAGLALSYGLLLLTHLPLAVIGSLSLAIYAILRLERSNITTTLVRLASGVVLALGATSFFWTTMLFELPWIKGNSTQPNSYYDYRLNFVFSPAALTNRNTWYANLLTLTLLGFFVPAIILVSRFGKQRRGLFAILILFVGSFVMTTPLSRPIWAIVPKLSEVQFPWRWLSITSMAGSLLLAASIPKWHERVGQLRPRDLAVALLFVLSILFTANEVVRDTDYLPRAQFQPLMHEIRGAVSFKDWLPIWANDVRQVEK